MDANQFRSDFPEFSDTTRFPDSLVTLWLTVGASLVNECRWGELTNIGIELVTAHHLAIAARDQQASAGGGIPGQSSGPMSSKAVDKVSASYDTGAASLADAGFWNLTSYGTRFLGMARLMGAGGMQL